MSREMIVGREYIVGAQHDYDELLDHAMGAEPQHAQQQHQQHQHPQQGPPPSPYAYQYPPPQGWPPPHPRATSPAYEREASRS